jgi:hypothetical protein
MFHSKVGWDTIYLNQGFSGFPQFFQENGGSMFFWNGGTGVPHYYIILFI